MEAGSWDRYVFLTDGARFYPLVKVAVSPSGIYVVDPNTPGAGKISFHESGAFNLGQPRYDPPVLYGQLDPPEGIHGYQLIARHAFGTHGLDRLVASSQSRGPSGRRPGPVVDLSTQPSNARFLEVEVGVRCSSTCHAVPDVMFPSRRVLRDETPLGGRALVISASWLPLFGVVLQT